MRVSGAAGVVVMPEPSEVRRVGAVAVGAGVAVGAAAVEGWSGAAAFTMWVAAKAEMPVKVDSVTAVATTRSAKGESMIGRPRVGVVRIGMEVDDQTRPLGA